MIFGDQVEAAEDVSAADWISDGLGEFGSVGGLVPDCFEHCVLVWHAADRSPGWSPPNDVVARLARLLQRYTSTPASAWFAVWEGHGFSASADAELSCLPRLELPNRTYYMLTGHVVAAAELRDPGGPGLWWPDLWWPTDRRWFVATDTDLSWTYVGGDQAVCESVMAEFSTRAKPVERTAWNGSVAD